MRNCEGRLLKWSALTLTLAAAVAVVFGQSTGAPNPQSKLHARQEKIANLLETLRNSTLRESDADQVVSAMRQLGDLRAVEAINDLVGLLTFRRIWPWEKEPKDSRPMPRDGFGPTGTTTARYPATSALTSIGKPALPALVTIMESHDVTSLESKNARHTVRMIFHMHGGDADAFFKEVANKGRTPEAKQRLLKALETADEDFKSD